MSLSFRVRTAALAIALSACAHTQQSARPTPEAQRFVSSWQSSMRPDATWESSVPLAQPANRASQAQREGTSFTWRAESEPRLRSVDASHFAANRNPQPFGWPAASR